MEDVCSWSGNIYGYDFEDGMKQHQGRTSNYYSNNKDDDDQLSPKKLLNRVFKQKGLGIVSKAAMELYKFGVQN